MKLGGLYGIVNNSYYLYNGQYTWTLSSSHFNSLLSHAGVWSILQSGAMDGWDDTTSSFSVRPVINLRSDVTISKGDGTALNPYVIQL